MNGEMEPGDVIGILEGLMGRPHLGDRLGYVQSWGVFTDALHEVIHQARRLVKRRWLLQRRHLNTRELLFRVEAKYKYRLVPYGFFKRSELVVAQSKSPLPNITVEHDQTLP